MKNSTKQEFQKNFVKGVYQTICYAERETSPEESKRILEYTEKIDITNFYKQKKEECEKVLSYGSIIYHYKTIDAIVDGYETGKKMAESIAKRLGIK